MEYYTANITPGQNIPIPIPGLMNTFKEPDRYGEKDKPNKTNQDTYERRTRTPAPKIEKTNKKNNIPRRRTDNVDKTQFTNANK